MALVKFLTLKYRTGGAYDPGSPVWINPEYVVAVYGGCKSGAQQHAKVRLHGDDNPQDHTDIWDAPETVIAVLREAQPNGPMTEKA